VPSQEINGILFDLLIEISAARHTISKVALSRTAYLATPSPNVFRSTTGKSIKLTLHDAEVEINEQQYEKLRWLYESDIQATQFGGTCAKPSLANTFCESGITFHSAVFAMLCRYASAHGGMHCMAGGHHNALHGDVFDALNIGLGVHAECCASPLNCHWRLYCSGHPDTDLTFGSLGSVFSFDPVDGYFECNPPFEESVLLDCIKHIDSLLDVAEVAGKSLSCVFIVPHWPGRRAWDSLRY
jgi:phosphorylated CTD-interacting factor 1